MRIATAIIALALMLVIGFQSCAASFGANLSHDQSASSAAGAGFVVAFLFLLGGAFAYGVPIVSVVAFVLAVPIALVAGFTSDFRDLQVWGFVSIALAGMSFFAFRARRRTRAAREQ